MNWWNKRLRILDYVYYMNINEMDCKEIIEQIKKCNADTVHFTCHDHAGGLCEDSFYHKSRVAKKVKRDILGEFLPLAKKEGVRVVAYLNGHWFKKSFADKHPDWWVIKSDGKRHENLYGSDDAAFCVNTPFRDWHYTIVEDLLKYDIDGIFFDGPLTYGYLEACNCDCCKAKFLKVYGRQMPKWDKNNYQDWLLLNEFSVNSLVDYYSDAYKLIKSIKPDVLMYCNSGNVGEKPNHVGRDNRKLVNHQDILASEGGFIYSRVGNCPFKVGSSAKLYETQAGNKPTVLFSSMAMGSWRWHTHTPVEAEQVLYNASISASPYDGLFSGTEEQTGVQSISKVYGFLKDNAEYYHNTVSQANIAILYSAQTVSYYSGVDIPWADIAGQENKKAKNAVGNFTKSFYGFYEMLVRSGFAFDIIDEIALGEPKLDQYKVLIVPNVACLSVQQCNQIERFVESGGLIIADFESSHYDQYGQRLKDFGLGKIFGIESNNKVSDYRKFDYILRSSDNSLMSSADYDYLPGPHYNISVNKTASDVLWLYSKNMISNIPKKIEASEDIFMVKNKYGKGCSFYMSGTFSEYYNDFKTPEFRKIIEKIILAQIHPTLKLSNCPGLVEPYIRYQPKQDRFVVHLVNLDTTNFEKINPLTNIEINILLDKSVKKVFALHLKKDLSFSKIDNSLTLKLPLLEVHEAICLE